MLADIISEKEQVIRNRWFEMIVSSYPGSFSTFLKKQTNPFADPVGHTIREMTTTVLSGLCNEGLNEKVYEAIDRFIRIRAVQDFSPSTALDFLFMLKQIFKEELMPELNSRISYEEFYELNSNIDRLILKAFESYVKYREKIYELKVNEFKNMAFRLLEKANLTFSVKDDNAMYEQDISDIDHVK